MKTLGWQPQRFFGSGECCTWHTNQRVTNRMLCRTYQPSHQEKYIGAIMSNADAGTQELVAAEFGAGSARNFGESPGDPYQPGDHDRASSNEHDQYLPEVVFDGKVDHPHHTDDDLDYSDIDLQLPAAVVIPASREPPQSPPCAAAAGKPRSLLGRVADVLRGISSVLPGVQPQSSKRKQSAMQTAITNGISPAEARLQAQTPDSLSARLSGALSGILRTLTGQQKLGESRSLTMAGNSSPLQGRHSMPQVGKAHHLLVEQREVSATSMHSLGGRSSTGSAASRRRGFLVHPSSASTSEVGPRRLSSSEGRQRGFPLLVQHSSGSSHELPIHSIASSEGRHRGIALTVQHSSSSSSKRELPRGSVASSERRSRGTPIHVQYDDTSTVDEGYSEGVKDRRVVGSGANPQRGKAITVQHGNADTTDLHTCSRSLASSEKKRRGVCVDVQRSSGSTRATDAAVIAASHGSLSSSSRRHHALTVQRSTDSVRSAEHRTVGGLRSVSSAQGLNRRVLLNGDKGMPAMAGSIGSKQSGLTFRGLGSRVLVQKDGGNDGDLEKTKSVGSRPSTLGFWNSMSNREVQGSSLSVVDANYDTLARSVHSSRSSNMSSRNRCAVSIQNGNTARRAVLIVQHSHPSVAAQEMDPHWLKRSTTASSKAPSSTASRRSDIMQVGRTDSVTREDLRYQRSIEAAGSSAGSSTASSRRGRPLAVKRGLNQSRRNYGLLVQISTDSV
jgi:hypothetical protein